MYALQLIRFAIGRRPWVPELSLDHVLTNLIILSMVTLCFAGMRVTFVKLLLVLLLWIIVIIIGIRFVIVVKMIVDIVFLDELPALTEVNIKMSAFITARLLAHSTGNASPLRVCQCLVAPFYSQTYLVVIKAITITHSANQPLVERFRASRTIPENVLFGIVFLWAVVILVFSFRDWTRRLVVWMAAFLTAPARRVVSKWEFEHFRIDIWSEVQDNLFTEVCLTTFCWVFAATSWGVTSEIIPRNVCQI